MSTRVFKKVQGKKVGFALLDTVMIITSQYLCVENRINLSSRSHGNYITRRWVSSLGRVRSYPTIIELWGTIW